MLNLEKASICNQTPPANTQTTRSTKDANTKLAISLPTKTIGFSRLPKPQTNHNNENTGENWAVHHQSKRKLH